MASRIVGRAIQWVHNDVSIRTTLTSSNFRIVGAFETITSNLALNGKNFSLSEEDISVKSDRVSSCY